ncbi:DUF423 domain-containing protein [Falsochrobactrum shanghaiense]|uniref:DUF423 domain-containing protein n=1 Tax=Falsochrobactrum shanghaiense TaxID=2201899 RepID=A0A316J3V8_9HYPH|nr:DUF423 domain-containing protein [Falsochrobactrum shanghaiense]PWL16364.1 DUF423 domain-containing protein [Falsochrobactrum shanghaiense]
MSIPHENLSHNRLFSTLAGLCGALAIVAYAGSAHSSWGQLTVIAPLLLAHAPALLVLSLIAPASSSARIGGALLFIGLALFCGSLFMLDVTGERLFPYSAPTGGTLMILGWLVVGLTGWFSKRR